MKKVIIFAAIISIITIGAIMVSGVDKSKPIKADTNKHEKIQKDNKQIVIEKNKESERVMPEDHSKKSFDCKSCHLCEYPTVKNPCLKHCPRSQITVYHAPDEGPDVITMEKLTDRYGKVVFPHKIHAQMAEMSGGCESCHHYNTTGPVLNCKNCHLPRAEREDITIPDLEAAYHRQCMQCHRQWNRSTNCYSCHLPYDKGDEELNQLVTKLKEVEHPELPRPIKIVYETESDKGELVTFFHDEHATIFNTSCKSCHHDENCARCHDEKNTETNGDCVEFHKKVHRSFEQHHKPCSSCHSTEKCEKCHMDKEMQPFNHKNTTGWALGNNHLKLTCNECHKGNKFTKMNNNCTACHSNFASDDFNHLKSTGFKIDENHEDLECENCHHVNNYKINHEGCMDCHEEKLYPAKLPGKHIKK